MISWPHALGKNIMGMGDHSPHGTWEAETAEQLTSQKTGSTLGH